VIGSLALGGAETQLVRLVNGLDRNRFLPSIICMSERGALVDSLATDVPVISADESKTTRPSRNRMVLAFQILAWLGGTIRDQRPHVVHAYLPAAYVLGSLAASWVRVPLIIAGRRGLTLPDVYGTVRWRTLVMLANRVIDVHICNSKAVGNVAAEKEGVKPERIRIVYNGIDLPEPVPPPALPPGWRSEGASAAMVANLIHYKGHRQALQAVAKVVKRHPSFVLVLMGEGPEREALTRLVEELGIGRQVIFAGTRPDAARLLRGFDFTLLGSSEEGFPNALMESMAVGVPVVSTSVGGVPELVEDGVHGRLVRFGDVDAMAGAMTWMIEHPDERREMGERARRHIADEFSTERMVSRTESVYEEFIR